MFSNDGPHLFSAKYISILIIEEINTKFKKLGNLQVFLERHRVYSKLHAASVVPTDVIRLVQTIFST